MSNTNSKKQFDSIKSKYPDAILLMRVGDFYETFENDAHLLSESCGLSLTYRDNVKLSGFHFNSLDTYLPKLVRSGFRVAICEQLSNPSK